MWIPKPLYSLYLSDSKMIEQKNMKFVYVRIELRGR